MEEKSVNFEKIKGYYDNGLWSIDRVLNVVGKATGIIEVEYQEITGFNYPNKA
ncbi:XkdX family protein [Clostridium sp.]|uniref:XkdX family protein n=1 Tax=Clostridium sp. TaxID=1506 RepID=UPI002604795C|nr:XkdX family protein [Clostridium sp.]